MTDRAQVTLFLCGDVMTGRGVDQVLRHPCPPHLYEPYMSSALDYVALAERVSGPIPRSVDYRYIWGDALAALDEVQPDARIINLETCITTSEDAVPKGINYRMHPFNVAVLTAAEFDCCVLANNHVLDWGQAGLLETLATLARAGVHVAGAGRNLEAAEAPAVLEARGGARILVFGFGATDSGIPSSWSAGAERPGVNLIPDFSDRTVQDIARRVEAIKRPGDLAVASVHWGGNWGYEIPRAHRHFAHALVDGAGIDLVHGHSSHHPRAIEVYHDRPILYGCGDFLNDYEGIRGNEFFRADLTMMYLASFDLPAGRLARLVLVPMRIRNFRLHRATPADRAWLRATLDREYGRFGHRVRPMDATLMLEWG